MADWLESLEFLESRINIVGYPGYHTRWILYDFVGCQTEALLWANFGLRKIHQGKTDLHGIGYFLGGGSGSGSGYLAAAWLSESSLLRTPKQPPGIPSNRRLYMSNARGKKMASSVKAGSG